MNPPRVDSGDRMDRTNSGCGCFIPPVIGFAIAGWLISSEGPFSPDGRLAPRSLVAIAIVVLSLFAGLLIRRRSSRLKASSRSITGTAKDRAKGTMVGASVFAIFLLAGLGFSTPFVILAVQWIDSHGWEEARCTILSSEVRTHEGSDGDTYSIAIRYRYDWDGTPYESDRYRFTMGSSSGYDGKAEIVRKYPPGSDVPCWVDPEDPTDATLYRGVGWEMIFLLLPMVFVAIGALGLFVTFGKQGTTKREDWLPGAKADETNGRSVIPRRAMPGESVNGGDPLELAASSTPQGRLGCSILAAIFWNGILGIGVYFGIIKEESAGGCLIAFLSIFGLVGIGLLISIPYHALSLANPRLKARLGGRLTPGTTSSVTWSFDGKAERIRRLEIRLKGVEEAKYRSGTDTHTARNTFHDELVFDSSQYQQIRAGQTKLEIPAGTMHSFDGGNNKIVWTLIVRGDIARWPDVNEEFVLTIEPERR